MINNANKYAISDIFSVESMIRYTIPKFQREYSWNKDNWEELINDIHESDGSHFIGSIICINNGADTLKPELELIDGQQRLTTISLLFSAIYYLLSQHTEDADEESKMELVNLKFRLINKSDKTVTKMLLSHQNNNYSDLLSVFAEIGIMNYEEDVRNKGNRRIFKAFRYFVNRLESLSRDDLLLFLRKINSTMLVKIEVSSHSDAFLLFESLNNRGVPLSAIDLIKNKILAEVERKDIMSVDEAFLKWNKIIKNLEDPTIQERFLRQYYNAFKFKPEVKVDGIPKATRSNLIKVYENLIERDAIYIFNELTKGSSIYHEFIMTDDSESQLFFSLKEELLDLINVKAAPAYAFLLFVFSQELKDTKFYKELIKLLVKYFIRRNITDFPNTRNLDQIFFDLIDDISSDSEKLTIEYISSYLTDSSRFSSMDLFEKQLSGDMYEYNVDATRFVLSKIEEQKSTSEIHVDFWKRDGSKLIWTIEHIFPEGKNIPTSWVEMMANGDKEEAEKIQDDLVHKLGNLTLTGYNSSLSNFDFIKKRDRKDSSGNFIGYKNKLFLNDDLKDRNNWQVQDIKNRTEKLINIIKDIFSINGK